MQTNEKLDLINKMKYRNTIGTRMIAFFEGIQLFVNLSLNIFLKDTLHLEPVDMARIRFIQSLPWTIRPLYGLLTDSISVCGYKQKPYFALLFLINCISWVLLSKNTASIIALQILFFVIQFTLAFIEVVNRVIITETGRLYEDIEKKTKENIAKASTALQIGRLLASIIEGYFAVHFKTQTVFLISSALPVLVLIAGLLIIEKGTMINEEDLFFSFNSMKSIEIEEEIARINNNGTLNTNARNVKDDNQDKLLNSTFEDKKYYLQSSQTSKIIKFITNKNVYMPLIFVILYNSLPSTKSAIFFYSMNSLNIRAEQMGLLSIMINISVTLSMVVYNRYLSHVSWPTMIATTSILNCLIGFLYIPLNMKLSQPYISDFALIAFLSCGNEVFSQYTYIPFLYFASIIAPNNIRGTGTSIVITFWNLGLTLSEINGGIASKYLGITSTSFANLYIFVLIEKCGKVVVLVLLCFVNLNDAVMIKSNKNKNKTDKAKANNE